MESRKHPPVAQELPTWSELHGRSDPDIDAVRIRAWRDADPAEKLAQMTALIEAARQLSEAGRRHRATDEHVGSG